LLCDQVKDKLVEFIDNELSDEDLQDHLENCADCSKELASLRNIRNACRKWKDIRPSRNWKTDLKRKLIQSQRESNTEMEMLKSAIIGLIQRVQRLEQMQSTLPPTLEGEIMTVSELARYLRISTDKVYEMIDHIPKIQIGYEYRFIKESIDNWIRTLEQQAYPQPYIWSDWSSESKDTT